MIQISSYESINKDYIESICLYDSVPLRKIAVAYEKDGKLRRFSGRYGLRTIFLMEKGHHFLAPYLPKTYLKKLDLDEYFVVDPNRYAIRRKCILEITAHPNAGQKRDIAEMKKTNGFVSLTKGEKTNLYIFTESGRIYGVHAIKKGGEHA